MNEVQLIVIIKDYLGFINQDNKKIHNPIGFLRIQSTFFHNKAMLTEAILGKFKASKEI